MQILFWEPFRELSSTHTFINVYTCVHKHIHTRTHTHTHMYTTYMTNKSCILRPFRANSALYLHVNIYVYTHTNTHTQKKSTHRYNLQYQRKFHFATFSRKLSNIPSPCIHLLFVVVSKKVRFSCGKEKEISLAMLYLSQPFMGSFAFCHSVQETILGTKRKSQNNIGILKTISDTKTTDPFT